MAQDSKNYTPFTVYYPGGFLFDQVVNKIVPPTDIIKGGSLEIIPDINEPTGEIVGACTSNDVEMNATNLEMLFDKDYLIRHLNENLEHDTDAYWIVNMNAFIDGYIVVVKHGDALSFMPILSGHEVYGGFKDKTIYSQNEFAKLCEPKNCIFIVNDIMVQSEQPPIMHYGLVRFPLRSLLENLGFTVEWDGASESVVFSKADDTYSYVTSKDKNRTGNILKNGVSRAGGTCSMLNGRTMVDGLFIQFLCRELNIDIAGNADNHTIIVTNK